ncbi:MAG: flagellar hook-basal body protein [Defluviitaleaceae bacterium]|nr:flagellar hook-basal body protein [Defluviitaleaceae bacterium]
MIRGIYASGVGMKTNMNRMDVIANNLANADTVGFKRELPVQRSFTEHFMHAIGGSHSDRFGPTHIGNVRLGNFVDEVHIDFRSGSLRQTYNPLNMAIIGEGFFAISATGSNGETTQRFSRNGAFVLANDRTLRTPEGHAVLGTDGNPITVPDGELSINGNGEIHVRTPGSETFTHVGTVQIVNFENPQSLRPFGDNLFNTTPESTMVAFTGNVASGYLEMSNINVVREMVEMIAIQRNYEANQRVLTIADNTLGRAVNDIAQR